MNMMTLLPILTLDKSAGDDIRRNATLMALGAANPMINAVATRDLLDTAVKAERSNASLRAEVAQLRSAARKADAPAEVTEAPDAVAAAATAREAAGRRQIAELQTEVAGQAATIRRLEAEATQHQSTIEKLTAEVAALKAASAAPQTPADAGATAGATAGAGAGDVDTAAQTGGKPVK